MAASATKKYEEFDPSAETVQGKDCDIILVYVPGFKKEKLRVQLTSTNSVRISGERDVEESKCIRFQKEFPITPNIDTNRMTAKFEKDILYVRLPKLIIPKDKPDKKLTSVPQFPKPDTPADKPQPQTNSRQQTTGKTSPSDGSNKQAPTVQDVPQKTIQEDEPKAKNEMKSTKTVDSGSDKKFQEKKRENKGISMAGKGSNENVDGSGKTRPENYEGTPVDLASKLKMSRTTFYVVLVGLATVGRGIWLGVKQSKMKNILKK